VTETFDAIRSESENHTLTAALGRRSWLKLTVLHDDAIEIAIEILQPAYPGPAHRFDHPQPPPRRVSSGYPVPAGVPFNPVTDRARLVVENWGTDPGACAVDAALTQACFLAARRSVVAGVHVRLGGDRRRPRRTFPRPP
jgi:hypothetical protein